MRAEKPLLFNIIALLALVGLAFGMEDWPDLLADLALAVVLVGLPTLWLSHQQSRANPSDYD